MRKAFVIAVVLVYALTMPGLRLAAETSAYEGKWACAFIDEGDGVKKSEYEGMKVSDLFTIEFNGDGSMSVYSFGQEIPGTWQESPGGITAGIDGEAVSFMYQDGQLVNDSNGVTMYLEKEKAAQSGGLLSLLKGGKYTGTWVASGVDEGDGVIKTQIDGMNVSDLLSITINRDGSAVINNMGTETPGKWAEEAEGIELTPEGQPAISMALSGARMIVFEDGITIYFDRAAQGAQPTPAPKVSLFAGKWEATRYESMGYTFDIKMLFPDGGFLLLYEDGTGQAALTKDYTEEITWMEQEGELFISGSYVLSGPVYDETTGELSVFYGSNLITVVFRKAADEVTGPAVTAPATLAPAATPEPTAAPMPQPTTEPIQEPQATQAPTQEPPPATGEVTMTMFSARYPAPEWTENDGYRYDSEGYSSAKFEKKDDSGSVKASVSIYASNESVNSYRDKIKALTGYANKAGKDSLDKKTIGGIEFSGAAYENWGWNYIDYAARVPESRVSVFITLDSPENMEGEWQGILDSLVFTIPELTPPNVDPPMPEDGEPYEPETSSVTLGDKEVSATWLKTSPSIILDSIFDNHIALANGKLYALAGDRLYVYAYNNGELTPSGDYEGGFIQLADEQEYISVGKDGALYVSEGIFTMTTIREGEEPQEQSLSGKLVMHPDGAWGITFWSNADPMIVRVEDGKLTEEPWALSNLSDAQNRQGRFSSISSLTITNDRIYVAGTDALNNDAQRAAALDLDGKELFDFGGKDWTEEDSLGSVTGIVETSSGILVQDGNSREYKLFSIDGAYIGSVGSDDLLGTDYPWLSSMIASPDGVLVAGAQEREDGSADELLIFKLTGL